MIYLIFKEHINIKNIKIYALDQLGQLDFINYNL